MGLGEIKKKTQASKSIQTQSQTQEFKKDISYANHRRMSVQNHSVQLSPDLFDSVSDTENIEKEKQNISFSVTETKLHMDQAASDVIDGEAFLPEEMEIEEFESLGGYKVEEEFLSDNYDDYDNDEEIKETIIQPTGVHKTVDLIKEDIDKEYEFDEYEDEERRLINEIKAERKWEESNQNKKVEKNQNILEKEEEEQGGMSEELKKALAESKQREERKRAEHQEKKQMLKEKALEEEKAEEKRKVERAQKNKINYEPFNRILEKFNDPEDEASENFQRVKSVLEFFIDDSKLDSVESIKAQKFVSCYRVAVNYYNEHRGHRWSSKGKRRKEAVNELISFMQKTLLDESFPKDVRVLILQDMITQKDDCGFQSKKSKDFFEGEGKVLLKEETRECQSVRLRDDLRTECVYEIDNKNKEAILNNELEKVKREDRIASGKYKDLLPLLYKLDLREDSDIPLISGMKDDLTNLLVALDGWESLLDPVEKSKDSSSRVFTYDEDAIQSQFINCYKKAFDYLLESKNSSSKKSKRRKATVSNLKSVMEGLIDQLPLQEKNKEKIRQSVREIQNNREQEFIGERMAEGLRNAFE